MGDATGSADPGTGPACGAVVTSIGTAGVPGPTDDAGAVPPGVSTSAVTRAGPPGRPLSTLPASLPPPAAAAALSTSSGPNVAAASGAKWPTSSARIAPSASSPG